MPDINDILTSIKAAAEIARLFNDVPKTYKEAEQKLKAVELMGALADARMGIVEMQEITKEKDREIGSLKQALSKKSNLVRYGDAYYDSDDLGQPIGGPYCSNCWEVDYKTIHLVGLPKNSLTRGCPQCRHGYAYQNTPDLESN